jgi:hypothetical protein
VSRSPELTLELRNASGTLTSHAAEAPIAASGEVRAMKVSQDATMP